MRIDADWKDNERYEAYFFVSCSSKLTVCSIESDVEVAGSQEDKLDPGSEEDELDSLPQHMSEFKTPRRLPSPIDTGAPARRTAL